MATRNDTVWTPDAAAFPADGSPGEQLAFAVRYAVLAPSGHNAQPWRFEIDTGGGELHLRADRSRALPTADPDGRELVIGCGAALFHLRVALRHFGLVPGLGLLPDPLDPDWLATVRVAGRAAAGTDEERLFRAITRRRTYRLPFGPHVVRGLLTDEMEHAARAEGAWLHRLRDEPSRHALAALVEEGDRALLADPAFRHELAAWMRPNHGAARDGMPGYAFGMGEVASVAVPVLMGGVDLGWVWGARDRRMAEHAPVLAVLGTPGDTPADWLAAGQALSHVLLRAAADGLAASFLNQPVQVPALRDRLRETLPQGGFPQIVLRMGYPAEQVQHTPRRGVEEVVRVAREMATA